MNISTICICYHMLDLLCQICNHVLESSNACITFERVDLAFGAQDQLSRIIWATSWENLFLPYANNKGADQRAHPRILISAFVIHCLDSMIPLVSMSEISSLYIASVAVQGVLSLTWSEIPKTGFLMTRLMYRGRFRQRVAGLVPLDGCVCAFGGSQTLYLWVS